MNNKFKVGDIVYFKSLYTAIYSKKGGTYEYHFKPGDRYRINSINGGSSKETVSYVKIYTTMDITNLEDGTSHFAHSSIAEKIISIDEWREIKLSELGID